MLLIVKLVWFLLLLSIWQKTPCLKVQFRFVFFESFECFQYTNVHGSNLEFQTNKSLPPKWISETPLIHILSRESCCGEKMKLLSYAYSAEQTYTNRLLRHIWFSLQIFVLSPLLLFFMQYCIPVSHHALVTQFYWRCLQSSFVVPRLY